MEGDDGDTTLQTGFLVSTIDESLMKTKSVVLGKKQSKASNVVKEERLSVLQELGSAVKMYKKRIDAGSEDNTPKKVDNDVSVWAGQIESQKDKRSNVARRFDGSPILHCETGQSGPMVSKHPQVADIHCNQGWEVSGYFISGVFTTCPVMSPGDVFRNFQYSVAYTCQATSRWATPNATTVSGPTSCICTVDKQWRCWKLAWSPTRASGPTSVSGCDYALSHRSRVCQHDNSFKRCLPPTSPSKLNI